MQITKQVHAIKIPFTITVAPNVVLDRFVYAFLVCGETISLIDTGVAGSREMIFDYIKQIGRRPEEIATILLTHAHPDHLGAAKSIQASLNCPARIHVAEKTWAEDTDRQFRERPVPGFHSLVEGSVAIGRTLEDGETIQLDERLAIKVFHTPGHSPGSVSFFLENDRALFCGDAILLPGQMPIFENLPSCMDSIRKLKAIEGVDVLLPSWDLPQKGARIAELMDESLDCFAEIRETVKTIAAEKPSLEPTEFCKAVLRALNLPEMMANPLVLKSFQSILTE